MRRTALLLVGLVSLAAIAGDMGPVGKNTSGTRAWARNHFQNETVIRVYKKDPVLEVSPLMCWTNARIEVARESMVVTQIVHSCRVQMWSSAGSGGKVGSTHKSGAPYMRYFRGWVGTFMGKSDRHGGIIWDEIPPDYVDPYVVATNDWAVAEASSSSSVKTWDEVLSMTISTNLITAYDPVASRWYSSAPGFLGVQDGTAHALPFTFTNLGWLDSTNHPFRISTGFDGYVHLSYHSESNTVTFTRLYEGVLPYNETH